MCSCRKPWVYSLSLIHIYVLNPNEQKVTFTYVDDKTPVIKESLTFSDDRQKLDMSVTKLDAEDNTPVSYTHLDVYKRQVVNHLRKKNRNFRRNVSDVHIIKGMVIVFLVCES